MAPVWRDGACGAYGSARRPRPRTREAARSTSDAGPHGRLGRERLELTEEVLVAAVDDADAAHLGGALGGQRRDEVGEPAAQVRHFDLRSTQRGGGGDDGVEIGRASILG